MLFKCSYVGDTATFQFDGYIGQYDSVNSKEFKQELDALPNSVTTINVKINSGGGDVLEGMTIYDLLKNSGKTIKTECYGLAASFGFVLLLAGEERKMSKNSTLMAHRVSVGAYGDVEQIRNLAVVAERLENRIKDIVIEQSGQPKEVVDEWFKTGIDRWFDSSEALELGLVSDITGEALPEQINPNGLTVAEVYNKFYNKNINQKVEKRMKKEILEKLGLAENATTEDVENAVEKALTNLDLANASMAQAVETQAEELVNKSVESGKIKAEDSGKWLNSLKANFKETAELLNSIAEPVKPTSPVGAVSIAQMLQNSNKTVQNEDRSNWWYLDWIKNDSKGFQALPPEEQARIKAIKKP
jgi:ATP-dependent Clp endopeptidase proteolytic subunit ClpP